MRQRRVTGIEQRLAPYADLLLQGPPTPSLRGGRTLPDEAIQPFHPRWYDRLSPRYILPEGFDRIYVELGCGRGRFINALAAEDPEGLYIGVEGCKTFVIRALEKTRAAGLKNVRYIDSFINDATSAFAEESLDGIFLNFSDPWPKIRHADRRLTSPKKAAAYLKVLKPSAFATIKTDGLAFYEYSLASFTETGFTIPSLRGGRPLPDEAIHPISVRAIHTPTEYELKFRGASKPIHHFTATKP